jgi:hypothetical protein
MCLFVANSSYASLWLLRCGGEDGEVGAELAEFGDGGEAQGQALGVGADPHAQLKFVRLRVVGGYL